MPLGAGRQQPPRWSTAQMSLHRVEQERKDLATLWDAGGDRRPDALAPPAAFLTARPLADVPVDHHETSRLFGQMVRRVDGAVG